MTTRKRPTSGAHGTSLDRFDTALLNLLQDNNQLSSEALGKKVGLSPSAVQRRLKRLRESGVIVADVSRIAPQHTGNRVTLIVEVVLERDQLHHLAEFENSVQAWPEITQCYYVTGEVSFVLVMKMISMDAYRAFTEKVFFTNPNIKQFYTTVVVKEVRFSTKLLVGNSWDH